MRVSSPQRPPRWKSNRRCDNFQKQAMPANRIFLKIDVAGTRGDEAWRSLKHYDEMNEAHYGPEFGSSGECEHRPTEPHRPGEWVGAMIVLPTAIIAQY